MLLVNKRKQFSALREAAENAVALRNQERDKNIQKEKLLLEHFKASDKLHQLRVEEEKYVLVLRRPLLDCWSPLIQLNSFQI